MCKKYQGLGSRIIRLTSCTAGPLMKVVKTLFNMIKGVWDAADDNNNIWCFVNSKKYPGGKL